MPRSNPLRSRWCVIAALLAVLAGCSAAQLAYDNADIWLVYKANAYLDLNAEQSSRARTLAQEALERHRRQQLPRWMLGARDLAAAMDDGLTAAEVACLQNELLGLFIGTVAILAEFASEMTVDLDDKQIAELAAAVAKDNERFRERFLQRDSDERVALRVERVHGWIEYWTGDLLAGQRVWLDRNIRAFPSMSDRWAEYHAHERERLLAKVENDTAPGELRVFIETWWSGEADQSPSFRNAVERSRAGMREFAVSFDGILTSYQRDRVQSRLLAIADDMEELLSEGLVLQARPGCASGPAQVGT